MKAVLVRLSSVFVLALASTFPGAVSAAESVVSEHTLTGNLGLFSSYRFRGIDQSFGRPALQGGIDYSHVSGLYLGNWNSNVSSGAGYPEANLEMDFYGGYKTGFGDWGIDVGAIYYYYPGSHLTVNNAGKANSGRVDNAEVYLGVSWKTLSLKYSRAVSDYFLMPDSKGSSYLDLSASYDLGAGWVVGAHLGRLHFRRVRNADYTDWKLGLSKDVSGWIVGLAYVDTNAKGDCSGGEFYCFSNSLNRDNVQTGSKTRDAGRGTAILSVTKTF